MGKQKKKRVGPRVVPPKRNRVDFARSLYENSGYSTSEIASKLGVTVRTVQRYLSKIPQNKVSETVALERKLKSAANQLIEEKKKREHVEQELKEIKAREETSLSILKKSLKKPKFKSRRSNGRSPATAIICLNDWHSEANVDKELVSGLNEFNLSICENRVAHCWEKALYLLDFARNICDIQECVLWLGGDLINGYIHEELEEGNFAGPTEAVVFSQDLLYGGIRYFTEKAKLSSIRILTSMGNHGRSTRRMRYATGWKTSWEWLLYKTLSERNIPGPISWNIGRGYHTYETIQGHTVRFHHGEAIKYSGGVGGITVPVNKAIDAWNKSKHASYDIFGHFHQFMEHNHWVACGCLVGYDTYALSIKATFQRPSQTFIVIDRDYGKTMTLPIFVEKAA